MTSDWTADGLVGRCILPPRTGGPAARLPDVLLERFRSTVAADVSDLVGRLYTMDAGVRPLYAPMRSLVGTALTVKAVPGDNWAILGALARAERDDVLVIDWQGYEEGCGSGVLTLVPAIERGLAGVVIDGAWRDVAEIRALDFPIFGRGTSAYSPAKQELGEINVPVCCGRVIVEPGDVIVADGDGVAVVPRDHAGDVAEALGSHVQRTSMQDYRDTGAAAADTARDRLYRERFERGGGLER